MQLYSFSRNEKTLCRYRQNSPIAPSERQWICRVLSRIDNLSRWQRKCLVGLQFEAIWLDRYLEKICRMLIVIRKTNNDTIEEVHGSSWKRSVYIDEIEDNSHLVYACTVGKKANWPQLEVYPTNVLPPKIQVVKRRLHTPRKSARHQASRGGIPLTKHFDQPSYRL